MTRLSATFVILSIALATRGMPSSDSYDTKGGSDDSKQQKPKKQAFWGGGNCIDSCRSRWGWTGHVFGDDPWGRVMATGEPVPTSTSSSSSVDSTSSSTEAATVKIFNLPTASAPANVVPLATSSSSSTSLTTSSSTSSSSRSSSTSTSSKSEEASVNIFNAPVKPANTRPPTLPTTPEPEPTPTPEPEPEPETQAPPPPAPKPDPTPEPELKSDGGDVTGDRAEYLKFHNDARDKHGALPLAYSQELENFAQQWADNCVFEHSGGKFGRVGENLAAGTGVYSIEEMIGNWVDEVTRYNPRKPEPSHFTQVVWKDTTEVGCAKQTCNGILGNGPATYYVCEYRPAGNVIGNFEKNVQK